MIIAHVADDASVDSISFGFSGLRTCPNEAARRLCKTSQGRSITYGDFVESRLRQTVWRTAWSRQCAEIAEVTMTSACEPRNCVYRTRADGLG